MIDTEIGLMVLGVLISYWLLIMLMIGYGFFYIHIRHLIEYLKDKNDLKTRIVYA